MSDLHDRLDQEARRVEAKQGGLAPVLQRVRRRRMARRTASSAVALAIGAASLGVAYSAFAPSTDGQPAGGPVPGPTPTSDDATPPPLGLSLANGTEVEGLVEYTAARLQYEGVFIRDGGYRMITLIPDGPNQLAEGDGPLEVTTIFASPSQRGEAIRLRDAMFPGAELRSPVPGQAGHGGIPEVILGEDFARRNAEAVEAFAFATVFMESRIQGAGAEPFLSSDAARLYEVAFGRLSLYGYTADPSTYFQIVGFYPRDDGYRAIIRIATHESSRTRHEQVQVDLVGTAAGTSGFVITYAERNE